ncbi:biopolymer transporter ExbD [Parvibaculum sp.]|uniref:ExbD/TolR family protein n=1 Tax=Parvibaculum sp. TaxID=2024848 RepID=UPI000C895507|nr:biopolymer transporter ExbD [Parvibaculum sp.]MAB12983.1 biopolymer transporter ExbD [Parvibaculum sp.]
MSLAASRRLARPNNASHARISLTPLIDVIFILLIFFMLASRLSAWQDIDISIASDSGTPQQMTGDLHRVSLLGDGGMLLDGDALSADMLAARLKALPKDARLVVDPAAGVTLESAVRVLDMASGAGIAASLVAEEGKR